MTRWTLTPCLTSLGIELMHVHKRLLWIRARAAWGMISAVSWLGKSKHMHHRIGWRML